MASTVIYGARDAVLVDAFMTVKQATGLADWVAWRGKKLAETTKTAQELYDKMLEIYPNRVNPSWTLWGSVRAVKA